MIDFTKPMRIKADKNRLQNVNWPCAVVHDGRALLLVHSATGRIYKFMPTNDYAENIPEPVKRYQAQYTHGLVGYWHSDKFVRTDMPESLIAWLIETDHGEGATPRYTYEREDAE